MHGTSVEHLTGILPGTGQSTVCTSCNLYQNKALVVERQGISTISGLRLTVLIHQSFSVDHTALSCQEDFEALLRVVTRWLSGQVLPEPSCQRFYTRLCVSVGPSSIAHPTPRLPRQNFLNRISCTAFARRVSSSLVRLFSSLCCSATSFSHVLG